VRAIAGRLFEPAGGGTIARLPSLMLHGLAIGLLAFVIFGPLANLVLWSFAERWYFPHKLPLEWGFKFWANVFNPRAGAMAALWISIMIALLTVALSLALSVPAGYALAKRSLPLRSAIMLLFLLPQAFPSLSIYINVARIFYGLGLNGTMLGVVLVHTLHGLVYSVWITAAAFAAVDHDLELAARNLGATATRAFLTVSLPLAAPGIVASAIFVFLESLDEFTGSYFVGAPEIQTLPLLLFTASMAGNYQIASITALILLVPSILFMLMVERFLKGNVLSKVGT
jgi:putative spermidine/putrescine transport system permease protein